MRLNEYAENAQEYDATKFIPSHRIYRPRVDDAASFFARARIVSRRRDFERGAARKYIDRALRRRHGAVLSHLGDVGRRGRERRKPHMRLGNGK